MAYTPIGSDDPRNPNNYLKEELLQILNDGVNDIVIRLKGYLGNNTGEVDANAKVVLEALETLKTSITQNTQYLKQNGDNRVILFENRNGNTNIQTDQRMYNGADSTINPNINTLDDLNDNTKTLYEVDSSLDLLDRDEETRKRNLIRIQTRLNNCQTLEILYLRKHEELMKTFAFTINLFDKYKYSIKMILYLLKNLVNKRMPDEEEREKLLEREIPKGVGVVDLPKPIITNIQQLLRDQSNVQGVINDMDKALVREQKPNLGRLTDFTQDRPFSVDIKTPTATQPR